jgi:hypothetical protein
MVLRRNGNEERRSPACPARVASDNGCYRDNQFQAQRRRGPQEYLDETPRLIAEEYDALLAEIEVAVANQPEAERKNREAEAEILGDQGQSGG